MKKGYFGLWALLAVAFALVAAGSCFDSLTVMGHDFKTASIMEQLTRREPLWDIDTVPVSPDTTVVEKPKFPVETDTVPKTILFIGDSMLEGLSPRLAAYCKENGHKLYTVIWYSSTSEIWGRCDTLTTFISRFNPDYVMLCLGANELFVRDIKTKRDKYVKHILEQIGDRPYLWIGPPNWKPDTGINELVADNVEEGCFFLSDGMTFSRKSDGAHPTSASAREWMDSVVRWMPAHSAHPIKMDIPDGLSARATRVVVLQPVK